VLYRRFAALSRLRVALSIVFAAHGFIYASWAVSIPAVKEQTNSSSAALGLALFCGSIGAVATMLTSGVLCRQFGSGRLTVASSALLSVTLVLPALTHSAITLGLALFVFGSSYGCLNVAMNSVAVDVVAALQRPVMPVFHSAWNIGGLVGASVVGLLTPHLPPARHLFLASLASLVVIAISARSILNGGTCPADSPDNVARSPSAAIDSASMWVIGQAVVAFGLVAMCTAYDEGGIGDWSALHLRQDLAARAGSAAAGYAAFALGEACTRMFGAKLIDLLGLKRVLILGGMTATVGALAAAFAPDVPLSVAGFAVTGIGLANLFPAAMAQAGLRAGANGVAFASTLGYGGGLIGPPTIGFLAERLGLRMALCTIPFMSLAATFISFVSIDGGSRQSRSRQRVRGSRLGPGIPTDAPSDR
jgi:MFS family permease